MVNYWGEKGPVGIMWRTWPDWEKVLTGEDEEHLYYSFGDGGTLIESKTGSMPFQSKYPVETLEDFRTKIPPRTNPGGFVPLHRGKPVWKIPEGIRAYVQYGDSVSVLVGLLSTYGAVSAMRIGTWEGVPQSLSANMIKGIARLIITYGNDLKDTVFKEKLGIISVREIIRSAKERKGGSLSFAEAMLVFYNKKSRPGLEWAKLYTKKAPMRKTSPEEAEDTKESGGEDADTASYDTEDPYKESPGGEGEMPENAQMDLFHLTGNAGAEQSPQADFNSPIPSLMRGAQQDFGARAESRSDLPCREMHIPRRVLSHRKSGGISYEIKNGQGYSITAATLAKILLL